MPAHAALTGRTHKGTLWSVGPLHGPPSTPRPGYLSICHRYGRRFLRCQFCLNSYIFTTESAQRQQFCHFLQRGRARRRSPRHPAWQRTGNDQIAPALMLISLRLPPAPRRARAALRALTRRPSLCLPAGHQRVHQLPLHVACSRRQPRQM